MRLMHEQLRRIRETTSPEVRVNLLREHMRTMMDQMRAMRAMDGRITSGMMPRGLMRDHMQDRLDMMQLMMEQMMDHMQAMQGMTLGGKVPHR